MNLIPSFANSLGRLSGKHFQLSPLLLFVAESKCPIDVSYERNVKSCNSPTTSQICNPRPVLLKSLSEIVISKNAGTAKQLSHHVL